MSMRGLLLILTGFLFLLCPFRLLCLSFMLNTMCQSKKLVLSPQTATYSYHLMYYPYMCSRYGYSIDLLRPVVYVAIIVRLMHCSHVLSLLSCFLSLIKRLFYFIVYVICVLSLILVTTVLFAARWQRIRIAHAFNVLSTTCQEGTHLYYVRDCAVLTEFMSCRL
jgi:hypothetical protein